jgi:hypothetical protein
MNTPIPGLTRVRGAGLREVETAESGNEMDR